MAVGLVKGVFKLGSGKLDDALLTVGEALVPGAFQTSVQTLAWELVQTALSDALTDLALERLGDFTQEPADRVRLVAGVTEALAQTEVQITPEFFDRPGDHPIVGVLRPHLASWLRGFGLTEAAVANTAGRLRSYFVYALAAEWRQKPEKYGPILAAMQTPFAEALRRERDWEAYRAWLVREVDQPMFGESFGVRTVYQWPRAWYMVPKEAGKEDEVRDRSSHPGGGRNEASYDHKVVTLREEIRSWIDSRSSENALRVISGGPGSGKSSFAKMLAAELAAERQLRVLYIPLHLLDIDGDVVDAVGRFLSEGDRFQQNPLKATTREPLLLFFDGLDELALQSDSAAVAVTQFVGQIVRLVERTNQAECHLQALLIGRELVVQGQEHQLRKPGQILHLLEYSPIRKGSRETPQQRGQWIADAETLALDQRQAWWDAFREAKGLPSGGIPKALI